MRQARLEIFQWLTYYNARRRHSALNYLSPVEFEQQHLRTAKLSIASRAPVSTLRGTPQQGGVAVTGDVEGVTCRAAQRTAVGVQTVCAAGRAAQQVEEPFEGRGKRHGHEALLARMKGRDRACAYSELTASERNGQRPRRGSRSRHTKEGDAGQRRPHRLPITGSSSAGCS